jgi:hypothetical protein
VVLASSLSAEKKRVQFIGNPRMYDQLNCHFLRCWAENLQLEVSKRPQPMPSVQCSMYEQIPSL